MTCKHDTVISSEPRGFHGSVAHHPYTEENRRAHGGCYYVDTCVECGAERERNSNGNHDEYGTWSLPLAERQRMERERAERVERERAERVARAPKTPGPVAIEMMVRSWPSNTKQLATLQFVCDDDGYVTVTSSVTVAENVLREALNSAPRDWMVAAAARRKAVAQ